MKAISLFDEKSFKWIVSRPCTQANQPLPVVLKWISKSADGYFYPLILGAMYYSENTYGYLLLYTAALAYAFEVPLYLFLKHFFKRPRPCDLKFKLDTFVTPADKFSLPSGHTAAAFLMATLISFYYPSLSALAFVWSSSVGLSRIVLRVHYPSDVVIGAAMGSAICLASLWVSQ